MTHDAPRTTTIAEVDVDHSVTTVGHMRMNRLLTDVPLADLQPPTPAGPTQAVPEEEKPALAVPPLDAVTPKM